MIKRLKISVNVLLTLFGILLGTFSLLLGGLSVYKNYYVYDLLSRSIQEEVEKGDNYFFATLNEIALYKELLFSSNNLLDFEDSDDKQLFISSLVDSSFPMNDNLYYDVAIVDYNQYYQVADAPFYLDSSALSKLDNIGNNLVLVGKYAYGEDYTLVVGTKDNGYTMLFYLKEATLRQHFAFNYSDSACFIVENNKVLISTNNGYISTSIENLNLNSKKIVVNNKTMLVFKNTLPNISRFGDITSLSIIPTKTVYAPLETVQIIVSIFLGLSFAFVIFFSYLKIKRLVRPINKLSNDMSKLDYQNISAPLYDKSKNKNEIYILEESYLEMIKRINELMQRQLEDSEIQRKLELDSLQTQINPHFLYNSLDSIAWMSKISHNKVIEEFIILLARFYRLSLHKGAKYIKVSEEIDIAKYFLSIQTRLFPDQFTFEVRVSDEVASWQTLKLIIQPFIENAVKYAFHGYCEKGHIVVKAFARDDVLVYTISDNGKGFDARVTDQKNDKQTGFGIHNVSERLKLEYKGKATMNITSQIDKGTIVEITIPKTL